jgi:two-component system CheB/CheR fusion protein
VFAHSAGPGKGSDFVVRLPLVNAPPDDGEINGFHAGKQRTSHHIVLLEDNDDSREMLSTLLKLDGHQVSVASDGRVGLEMILHQRPDVAIVDVGLPQMSGLEVAREVRQILGKDIRLIALTGYGRTEDQEAVKRSGFDVHLVKPLKPMQLRKLLNSMER